eukprot:COSAG06_NODE_966_length_11290_cov_4.010097_7_plen_185_part_00
MEITRRVVVQKYSLRDRLERCIWRPAGNCRELIRRRERSRTNRVAVSAVRNVAVRLVWPHNTVGVVHAVSVKAKTACIIAPDAFQHRKPSCPEPGDVLCGAPVLSECECDVADDVVLVARRALLNAAQRALPRIAQACVTQQPFQFQSISPAKSDKSVQSVSVKTALIRESGDSFYVFCRTEKN